MWTTHFSLLYTVRLSNLWAPHLLIRGNCEGLACQQMLVSVGDDGRLLFSHSVMSISSRPYGLWHTRLLCPWRFSRQYWSRLPFPSPGDLLNPGIEPRSPTLQTDFCLSHQGSPSVIYIHMCVYIYIYTHTHTYTYIFLSILFSINAYYGILNIVFCVIW